MADYTPDIPLIVGNEWVPIKETPYPLDVSQELGTSFELQSTSTVVSGSAYGVETDGTPAIGCMLAVYPADAVDQTGPIKQVVIQCNGTSTSGSASFFPDSATVAGDLASAYDALSTTFVAAPGNSGTLTMNFDTLAHTELTGKRILKLEFLYRIDNVGNGLDFFLANSLSVLSFVIDQNGLGIDIGTNADIFGPDTDFSAHPISSIDVGDANYIWQHTPTDEFVYPWNYGALQLFDAGTGAATRTSIELFCSAGDSGVSYSIGYAALRVTYCEEQRVLVGGNFGQYWASGRNLIQLRPPALGSVGASLTAGDYVVTATRYTLTPENNIVTGEMQANAITELYPMEEQRGVVIPSTLTVGDVRVAQATPLMLQLGLHTSSAIVPDVHPYGVQIQAPAWGSGTNPASQDVVSSANGSATNYPYVRFYARRLPGTTEDLTFYDVATPAITATLTVEEFDALPEILDGWKQIDLTLDTPAIFDGAGGVETFVWESANTVGNQWQILAAAAPAVTGSFPRVQITGAQALDAATYGGSGAFLSWDGNGDTTADATLLFAQEMPAVSGLAVETASLEVTGIGIECGIPPACIPTGITYNALTWTAFDAETMPASGFGYYELQRYDTTDDAWSTILHAASPEVTGFSDFEARVGAQSDYRIRFVHRMLFASAWSSTVSSTIAAPGVSGSDVATGVLIFTANEVQSGQRSLAYAMQWETDVVEGFTFIEAASRQLQQMYGRDFQIAFRPLERGGEAFSRALLVQAAAVPSGLIRDGFTSLRDLAWEDVSYICVRDELGDRWLANVNVPDGTVRRNRRLYMANVDITEVTDTPSVVVIPDDVGCVMGEGQDGVPAWDYGCTE